LTKGHTPCGTENPQSLSCFETSFKGLQGPISIIPSLLSFKSLKEFKLTTMVSSPPEEVPEY
jgi:hypothetical protein